MALVLSGERPATAAASTGLLQWMLRAVARARRNRAQRSALKNLLTLEADRLDDLGITRSDLFDAMEAAPRFTRILADRRAGRNTHWLNP